MVIYIDIFGIEKRGVKSSKDFLKLKEQKPKGV